jgi:hypothetical protein
VIDEHDGQTLAAGLVGNPIGRTAASAAATAGAGGGPS